MKRTRQSAALRRAIEAMPSQRALADALGIKSPSICDWKKRGQVPHDRVLKVEALTGVSRHELRPDLYPPAEVA